MQKELIFFGVIGTSAGHYFQGIGGPYSGGYRNVLPGVNLKVLEHIDGAYPPGSTNEGGKYQVSIVPPLLIVAWWDYSVDKRPGSNANLIGYGYDDPEQMIDDAYQQFPNVMKRQPRPTPVVS